MRWRRRRGGDVRELDVVVPVGLADAGGCARPRDRPAALLPSTHVARQPNARSLRLRRPAVVRSARLPQRQHPHRRRRGTLRPSLCRDCRVLRHYAGLLHVSELHRLP